MTNPVSDPAPHPLRILRIASIIEGVTLLLLFLVAMPLKYMARLMVVALVPFGAWMVAGMLSRPRTVPLVGKSRFN